MKSSNRLNIIKIDGDYYIVDKVWHEVYPCKYEVVSDFIKGASRVRLNGKYGFIDKNGKEVIPLKYEYAEDFSFGLALVKLDSLFGYINNKGQTIIPFKFTEANSFVKMRNEVKAFVTIDGNSFFIDTKGKYTKL